MSKNLTRRAFLGTSSGIAAAAAVSRLPGSGAIGSPAVSTIDRDVPWLRAVTQAPRGYVPDGTEPASLVNQSTTLRSWKVQREQIRSRWLEYLRPLPKVGGSIELDVLEMEELLGVERSLVAYESEPGVQTRGYMMRPMDVDGPVPGVLVLHPTVPATIQQPVGLRDRPNDYAFALRLAQMGYVTFSPENFLWRPPFSDLLASFHTTHPDSAMNWNAKKDIFRGVVDAMQERHPGSNGMAQMLFDAQRGLDVLASRPCVDERRLGSIGHSLGAMTALYLAAFDDRLSVAVSSEPGISVQFQNWDDPWYLGEEIKDFGHDQEELLALIAPRPFLLIGGGSADGPKSWPYVNSALPIYDLYDRPRRMGLLVHSEGHTVPKLVELRSYQWLDAYL